jgi:class 3 adenylate cyclase/predicted ATPase
MFCDLVGSTDLSQVLDIEDLRELITSYQQSAVAVIEALGGWVAQYLGDGLLVYFGYPQAHEDDPLRAMRAGLRILDELPGLNARLAEQLATLREHPLRVRVGIHTGLVVVGEMGAGAKREDLAVGDTVNLAARLQAVAEPDTVVVTEETLRLARGRFVTQDRGLRRLKGIKDPVRVFRVVGRSQARSPLDTVPEHLLTPLIGRERDLARLLERWEQALEGRGQAVFLGGEAGVGKSRLVRALHSKLAGVSHTWFECFCSPFATHTAFFPLVDFARQILHLPAEATEIDAIQRIEAALRRARLDLDKTLPVFAELLSLPDGDDTSERQESPERRRRRTLDVLIEWTLRAARRRATVMLIEDIHWIDPSTREFIGLLLDRIADSHLFCLFTHRTEFVVPWPASAHVAQETLRCLSRDEAGELAGKMDQGKSLPADLLQAIAVRSDGIPLFVEELLKATAVQPSSESLFPAERPIPTTLHDSLMARLDRLGSAKGVAQLASALGREFPYRLLAAVADQSTHELHDSLARLVDAEILFRRGEPSDLVYTFKHALIQDAAYNSLLRRHRRVLQSRIARSLEELFADRVSREPEILGHHLMEAGEFPGAAEAFDRAGRLAASKAAYEEALAHYRRGLAAVDHMSHAIDRDRRELSLLIMLGNAIMATKGYGAPEIIGVWDRASRLAEQVEDLEELSSALNGTAVYHMQTGDCPAAVSHAQRILALAESGNIRIAALRGHGTMAQALFYLGDGKRALEHAERAIACYEPGDFQLVTYGSGYDQCVIAYGAAMFGHWWLGHFDRSLETARLGVALARSLNSSQSLAMALAFLAFAHYLRREPDQLLLATSEVKALSAELCFPVWHGFSLLLSGAARAHLERDPAALDEMTHGSAVLEGTYERSGASFAVALLAEAQWNIGQRSEASALVELGLSIAEGTGEPYYTAELLRMKGELLLEDASTDFGEGEAALRDALDLARKQRALAFELRAATSLGRLLQDSGRPGEAKQTLSCSLASVTEGQSSPDVLSARSLLGELG